MKNIHLKKSFPCDIGIIPEVIAFAREALKKREDIKTADTAKALLQLEEIVQSVIQKADGPDTEFTVQILGAFRRLRMLRIVVKCSGSPMHTADILQDLAPDDLEPEIRGILNSRLRPLLSEGISLRSRFGVNTVVLKVQSFRLSKIAVNLLAMAGGLLFGLLVKNLLPGNISVFIGKEIFGTVITIFFNLLKMIVAPLVFFSIMSSFQGFGDVKQLGRIGTYTMGLFIFFSVIGLFIGTAVYHIFPSGDPSLLEMVAEGSRSPVSAVASAGGWQNFKAFLLSIFPANFFGAFVDNDILAIIFLACITGACIGRLQTDETAGLNRAVSMISDLVIKVVGAITRVMPLIIFSSLAKCVITVPFQQLSFMLMFLWEVLLGSLIMLAVYAVALKFSGVSPVRFFKGFSPALLTGFTLASSTATLPESLRCCTEELHVSRPIASFVLPLGSTINMNGSCIVLTCCCLFSSKIYGITPTPGIMLPVLAMILLLSMAAPGVPGSMLIMLASILPMMGVPAEAADITVCFSTLVGMMMVPINCTGDAAVAIMIDREEKKYTKECP